MQKTLTFRFRPGKSVDQYRNRYHEPRPLGLPERPSASLDSSTSFPIVQRSKLADSIQYFAFDIEASCRRLPVPEVVFDVRQYPMSVDEEAFVALFHAVPVAGYRLRKAAS